MDIGACDWFALTVAAKQLHEKLYSVLRPLENCTQRNLFEIVLNQTQIRLEIMFLKSIYTVRFTGERKRTASVCCSKSIGKW